MAKIKSSVDDEPAESFTSMIDIVFLLLIFFILQPFKAPEMKLRSELPRDLGSGPSMSAPRLNLRLKVLKGPTDSSCIYMLNNRAVPNYVDISARLLAESNGDEEVPVILNPEANVEFRHVLRALDQCHKAGMRDIKFSAPTG